MRIKQVQYVNDYKLKILFSDGKTKIVDIEPIINKSKKIFKDLLYEIGVEVKSHRKVQSHRKRLTSSSASQEAKPGIAAKSKHSVLD